MIAYLLTASLFSFAIADEPNKSEETETPSTSDESDSTEEAADTPSVDPTPETEETDETDQPSEANAEEGEQNADAESSDQFDEGVKVIEAVIQTEINVETGSDEEETEFTTEEDTTEIEQMMSEIMQEMAESENSSFELNIETEEESEEEFNYKGNIEYSYVLALWDSPSRHSFHVGQFSGDPQYYFKQNDTWGYTVGGRFQVSGSETLSQRYDHTILGVTGGLQYSSFRINTSVSWTWEQYFAQTETDKANGFVTYQYDELAPMSGVLWENTLTYSPDDMDFGVQAAVGFPFQVTGERDMGQAFQDAWQVSTRLSLSFFHWDTRVWYILDIP